MAVVFETYLKEHAVAPAPDLITRQHMTTVAIAMLQVARFTHSAYSIILYQEGIGLGSGYGYG